MAKVSVTAQHTPGLDELSICHVHVLHRHASVLGRCPGEQKPCMAGGQAHRDARILN